MLPCNVILRSIDSGDVMVSAVDPGATMQAIDNESLRTLAQTVRLMLSKVVADV